MDNSTTFLVNNNPLPFILSDRGYDVWMTNNRATLYSNQHINLGTAYGRTDPEYYNFSFDEMGKYDVPANIDYIRKESGHDKIIYIGHSQGTLQFWIASIYYPDLSKKILSFVGLGPAGFLSQSVSSKLIFSKLFWVGFYSDLAFVRHFISTDSKTFVTFQNAGWLSSDG
jgi:lysosomal acid lipase/cholesteryl ester hydrolase